MWTGNSGRNHKKEVVKDYEINGAIGPGEEL
jgi:hypothetical protein